jgi:hypothetical protein
MIANHTIPEIITEIDDLLSSDYFGENYEHGKGKIDSVGLIRFKVLQRVREVLTTKGFPVTLEEAAAVSLVPSCLQEANYDNLLWTDQDTNLWQLQPFFDIDYMVQNRGMDRVDATEQQFIDYVKRSLEIIKKNQ